jgi:hypothetical protein
MVFTGYYTWFNFTIHILMTKDQLYKCIFDLAERAHELKEPEIGSVLFTLAGAIQSPDELSLPILSGVCKSFAQMELDRMGGSDINDNN